MSEFRKKVEYIPVNLLKNPGHLNLKKDVTDALKIRREGAVQYTKARKVCHIFQQKNVDIKTRKFGKKDYRIYTNKLRKARFSRSFDRIKKDTPQLNSRQTPSIKPSNTWLPYDLNTKAIVTQSRFSETNINAACK